MVLVWLRFELVNGSVGWLKREHDVLRWGIVDKRFD